MNGIRYTRPRGAIHDLEHLESLSASRNRLLCVSDRTLYLLHNLASLDIGMAARWAEELQDYEYVPVSEGAEHYDLFLSAVGAFQLEVLDMSCDIVASLAEIRDAIQQIGSQQAAQALACCNYAFDPATYYEDAPGSGTPGNKCLLSYAFALAWERGANEFYHQWVQGAFPSVGILSAILDEFDLPGQAILEMVSIGASNALPVIEAIWQGQVSDLVLPLTCELYLATDSASAKNAIYSLIEAQPGIHPVAVDLLEGPIQNNGLNKVFDGTFPTAGVTSPDCDTLCAEENCGGPKWLTGCDPNDEGECGSGDLSPGLARHWTATYDSDTDAYLMYPYLDTNRELTFVSIVGWTEKPGQPPCRWFGCFDGVSTQLGSADDPANFPDATCCYLCVVASATPFSIVANIGDVCAPTPP